MSKAGKLGKNKTSLGTTVAQQMRAEANKLTDPQRDESMAAALQIIAAKAGALRN